MPRGEHCPGGRALWRWKQLRRGDQRTRSLRRRGLRLPCRLFIQHRDGMHRGALRHRRGGRDVPQRELRGAVHVRRRLQLRCRVHVAVWDAVRGGCHVCRRRGGATALRRGRLLVPAGEHLIHRHAVRRWRVWHCGWRRDVQQQLLRRRVRGCVVGILLRARVNVERRAPLPSGLRVPDGGDARVVHYCGVLLRCGRCLCDRHAVPRRVLGCRRVLH